MEPSLKTESDKLTRSWMRHDAVMLRDYLVAGVEDPRLNLQSIFSRHFLIRALFGTFFEPLMEAEYRFSAVLNWLRRLTVKNRDPEELAAVLYALKRGADNAEGIEIPAYVLGAFAGLPTRAGELMVPNYVAAFLSEAQNGSGALLTEPPSLDLFRNLWQRVFLGQSATSLGTSSAFPIQSSRLARVFEPACGSANDYRFLHACGLARFFDYTGLDLCAKNVENARTLFPQVRFDLGNVFELDAANQAFDFCFTHDLFEHLSIAGLEVAIRELCRVTTVGICAGFFNMDEIPDHVVCPLDEYHWNTLSMARTRELFARHGFAARVFHIGTFLRQHVGCDETHNPNAYTFILWRQYPNPRSEQEGLG